MAMSGKNKLNLDNYMFIMPGLILFMLIIFIPYLMNIGISFTKWSGANTPKFVGLANYVKALKDETFWRALLNNGLLVIAMTILPIVFGVILAVLLFEIIGKSPLKKWLGFFRGAIYLPQIIALVISAVAFKWILHPQWGAINVLLRTIGLSDYAHNWLGDNSYAMQSIMAVMTWYQTGYALVVFLAALQRINPELFEASEIDGANRGDVIISIIVPQISFELSVVTLTTLIHALKVFGPVYAMTKGGPGDSTYVVAFYSFKNFFEKARVGLGSAVSTIISIIIIGIALVFFHYSSRQEKSVLGER